MARAAVLLLVVGAMALVLVMAPVRVASAQFIGITGPGGASVTTDTLDPPTGLGADTSTAGQIDLTWTPTVDGYATGYRIYRSETSGSGYALVDTVLGAGSTGYSDVFTPTKRTYYYVVETHYAGWSSVSSNEATANVGYDGIIRATGGLVSYWRLGLTTTTSIAPDDWGPSDGTPSGGFTPGVGGAIVGDSDTAANFTGSGDVNAGNHSSLQLNSGTVEAWIRTSNAGNGYREIVSKEGVYYLAARDNVLGVYDDGSGRWRSSGFRSTTTRGTTWCCGIRAGCPTGPRSISTAPSCSRRRSRRSGRGSPCTSGPGTAEPSSGTGGSTRWRSTTPCCRPRRSGFITSPGSPRRRSDQPTATTGPSANGSWRSMPNASYTERGTPMSAR